MALVVLMPLVDTLRAAEAADPEEGFWDVGGAFGHLGLQSISTQATRNRELRRTGFGKTGPFAAGPFAGASPFAATLRLLALRVLVAGGSAALTAGTAVDELGTSVVPEEAISKGGETAAWKLR
jgi:hypothetical protein